MWDVMHGKEEEYDYDNREYYDGGVGWLPVERRDYARDVVETVRIGFEIPLEQAMEHMQNAGYCLRQLLSMLQPGEAKWHSYERRLWRRMATSHPSELRKWTESTQNNAEGGRKNKQGVHGFLVLLEEAAGEGQWVIVQNSVN